MYNTGAGKMQPETKKFQRSNVNDINIALCRIYYFRTWYFITVKGTK